MLRSFLLNGRTLGYRPLKQRLEQLCIVYK